MSRRLVGLVLAGAVSVGAWSSFAHVAPSERENNRYLLVAPLGDRVRLAYTVYMGQVPGRGARARMDADGDRRLSDGEARRYGDEVAAQVAPRLSIEVDGRPVDVAWQVDVGLGQPVTNAGAFAVDLVAWICLERPRERTVHRLRLRDRFHLPDPGETELSAEESPGVRITRSQLGSSAASPRRLDFRWMGGPGPAETAGYLMEFEVDPALAMFGGDGCGDDASAEADGDGIVPGVLAAGLVIVAAALLLVRRARRRRRAA
jgi:hypothetical protein